jgi:cell fate (sporulation/competence/biofilm development) regulator YlbF (YheA/YmcA/DUF963 family)
MVKVYDTANQLERELRETPQYNEVKKAYETIRTDEEANKVLTEFQELQQTLFSKQQMGQEITEEEQQKAQEVSNAMAENELTVDLMNKERDLNQVLQDVNTIIMKPLQEIYQN